MCGIAGYHNVPQDARQWLVAGLGLGIDSRGGHAAGYVSIGQATRVAHKLGEWGQSSRKFIRRAASGHVCMMHARYTTHGHKGITNAHPFTIQREGKTVLHGCHNGMLYGTEETAKRFGRKWSVDSREVFELLADGELSEIQSLTGYGVITWNPHGTDHIKVAKLTQSADFTCAQLKEGGLVWASTDKILDGAVKAARLEVDYKYKELEAGKVYLIRDGGIFTTEEDGVKVDGNWGYGWGWGDEYDSPRTWTNNQNGHSYVQRDGRWERKDTESDYCDRCHGKYGCYCYLNYRSCEFCGEYRRCTESDAGTKDQQYWLCRECFASWGVSADPTPSEVNQAVADMAAAEEEAIAKKASGE